MKISVIYDSRTGNTKQAAEWILEGMRSVEGVEAEAFHLDSVDEDFIRESRGVVIGSPVYSSLMTPDLRTWLLEKASKLGMAGKLGGAFATVQYTHGGGELVIQSILGNELTMGMVCYSSGGEFGAPYIPLGPVGVNGNVEGHNSQELYKDYFVTFGKRFGLKAMELFGAK